MPKGHITHYNRERRFGFIYCTEVEDQVFFHASAKDRSYVVIRQGDKVSFELVVDGEGRQTAINMHFLGNASLEGLRHDHERRKVLKGYLKVIEGRYYVKDVETHLFIPLIISRHEVNVEKNYAGRNNELIDYTIIRFTRKNEMYAAACDREFNQSFHAIMSGMEMVSVLDGVVKGGYAVELMEGCIGFIPGSVAERVGTIPPKGSKVRVKYTSFNDYFDTFVLDLLGPVEDE